ncbi:fatty-acyl-CoA synthase [Desulfacinum hydrothermale DSM 13146]|uniref:Fatty-acyl-CoA synthase n=1 Tax=Desulfacinum hydrothermale DSM 13146 TaxID=1121390 RepID=A0A1W1WZV0_9BACT|nr:long-chain fatty acid--CoA ligase [Desulfacinum hydrothermale]SMC17060.1 fatty-acyl-CoA synthase [Desulfacinum hydrothermale DSM 13146]
MKEIVQGFPATSNDDYPLNMIAFMKHAAQNYPETEVVSRNLDGSLRGSTYGEIWSRVKRLAKALEGIGVRAGDRVGALDWNTHRFMELYFAVSGIGAVLLELNPRISAAERAYVLNHSEARFVAVSASLLPVMEPLAAECPTVQALIVLDDLGKGLPRTAFSRAHDYEGLIKETDDDFQFPWVDERSACTACYTSGTTGKPKGVYNSHRAMYLHTLAIAQALNITQDDVILQIVPMFHAQGWGMFFCGPMLGAKLVFPGRYTMEDPSPLVDLLVDQKVTVTCGAPAIFLPMLHHIKKMDPKPDLTGLRMISGATEPPLALMKGYHELGGARVIHAYGATETAPLVTVNHLKPSLKDLAEAERWELRKKQGFPVPGLDVKVVGPDGAELPRDGAKVGEVHIRGPWITRSYYKDSRSAESFTEDGYWRSGDAGTIDPNGYLKITDRFKDLIKSGGEWISSIDLENAIMAHPDVLEAAVIGIPHPKWEERPLALVVLHESARGTLTQEAILDFIRPHFAKWQLPDEVLFVDAIPKTSVGKFAKRVAREQYAGYYGGARGE